MARDPGPVPNPSAPKIKPPPKACDTQFHVFGPAAMFPFREDRKYDPPDATVEDAMRMHDLIGVERGVIVHPSIHGLDMRPTLYALEKARGRYRGVAVINDTIAEAELERMHVAGIRGIRFNFVRFLGGPPDMKVFERALAKVAPLGWHLVVHVDGNDLVEHAAMLRKLSMPLVIDHMGHVDVAAGFDQKPFRVMLDMMKDGNTFVKIATGDRESKSGYPWDDVVPYGARVVETSSERVIWGTDWPHPQYKGPMPDEGKQFELFCRMAPDEKAREQILVKNPETLYGF
jgi:2-pyrone-4,6-dicarboxylate lactonase